MGAWRDQLFIQDGGLEVSALHSRWEAWRDKLFIQDGGLELLSILCVLNLAHHYV